MDTRDRLARLMASPNAYPGTATRERTLLPSPSRGEALGVEPPAPGKKPAISGLHGVSPPQAEEGPGERVDSPFPARTPLDERLRRLSPRAGAPREEVSHARDPAPVQLARSGAAPPDDEAVAAGLGGQVIAAGVVLVETRLPAHHAHGRVALADVRQAPLQVLTGGELAPEALLFLDTETTGLAGGTGTLAFLLGLARLEGDALCLRQYFLTGFRGEAAMLDHARTWLAAAGHLVSYNGKTFDVPLLQSRHRLCRLPCPLSGKPHLDLLHATRAAFAARWADCRLQRAEIELFSLARQHDLPGWLVPQVWSAFVRTGALGDVPRVLEHNRLDVISLVALTSELAQVHARPGYRQADAHALARSHLRGGRRAAALTHLESGRATLDDAGLLELARLYRQRGEWDKARAVWQPLADRGVVPALLALAKYHEHVARDYTGASAWCRLLAARQPDEPAHLARLARLRRKLGMESPVTRRPGP